MIKWIFIIVAVIATLSLNGCAKDATAEDSMATTPTETSTETTTNSTSSDKEWIAVVLTWRPVIYTIDKEFTSEVDCCFLFMVHKFSIIKAINLTKNT